MSSKSKFYIIDRRKNQSGKSDSIRQRFINRNKLAVRAAVKNAITSRKIKDSTTDGATVKIKDIDTKEWSFYNDRSTGVWKGVNPGNKKFHTGDLVLKPPGAPGSNGNQASADGEGEDEFSFNVTKEELEEFFFDELCLPDLVKKNIKNVEEFQKHRAGFSTQGVPCNLDLVRSMKNSIGRELSFDNDNDDLIYALQQQLESLINQFEKTEQQIEQISALKKQIAELVDNADVSPSLDKMDLQYRAHTMVPVPNTRAVMFCVMDVSGSMGEHEKTLAKYFFILLFLFLSRSYKKVDIRFIRHHSIAKEVDEEEFFHSKESGGTVVSGALNLMNDIIKKDYNDGTWNIYGAQASDGDNWGDDSHELTQLMVTSIMPVVQYFAYIEVLNANDPWRSAGTTDVWKTYEPIKKLFGNLDLATVNHTSQIFAVFAELFSKNRQRRKQS
jgi:uncharacterized sporulation protein YeaH/YhbH (DUF444 family)